MRSQFANTADLDRREQEVHSALSSVEKSINKLVDAVEETNSHTVKERLKQRENERIRIQADLYEIRHNVRRRTLIFHAMLRLIPSMLGAARSKRDAVSMIFAANKM